METLEEQLLEEETKLDLLKTSIESTWPIYLVLFLVIAFGTYGVETLFEIDHKEYPFDGIYMISILIAFIYHVKRLYSIKLRIRESVSEILQEN